MDYATQADIEARYPGELAQAGPRDATNALDSAAIAAACCAASAQIDAALHTAGWIVPLPAPLPEWVTDIAVEIALYRATPTALASQGDFADRRLRAEQAQEVLRRIAAGELHPPKPTGLSAIFASSKPRIFGRGVL